MKEEDAMFKTIVAKELQENIRDFRFIIAALLCMIIIPLGFFINAKEYQAKEQYDRDAVRIYEDSHKRVIDVMRLGAAAFRPSSPLSLMSRGVEALLPTSVETIGYVTNWGAQTQFVNTRSLDNPLSFLFGRIDLSFIVAVIMSLLAMLFTYNAVAGEKEKRTLSQVLANAVPRNTVILAKMTAGSLLVGVVFLLGILLGLSVLLAMGHVIFSDAGLFGRFLMGVAVSLLYILVFLNFGLLVSTLNKSALSAIVSLMVCWVFLFLILPRASVIAAKIIRPVKSQQVIDIEKNQVRMQMQREEDQEVRQLQKTMPGVKDMDFRTFFSNYRKGDENAKAYEKRQNEVQDQYRSKINAELGRIDALAENERRVQAEIARNISRLSPVSCFVHIMAELSNTGFAEYKAWQETRSRFAQTLDREIADKTKVLRFGNMATTGGLGNLDRAAPAPKAEYKSVKFRDVAAIAWPDLVVLFLFGVVFFAGSYVAFLKYDVR
jgi:ABC-type transport system involved in multi-copper enzyme maturation permease subunit